MSVVPLADSDRTAGGKAAGLARLIAAQLPVPEGFAIGGEAFRALAGPLAIDDAAAIGHALGEAARRIESAELPPALVADVEARALPLGRLAVRSSATIEDGEAGAAAGVFSSRIAVPPGELWPAIRAVWASALTPLAASYARRRHAELAVGVIVQRYIDGERATVYTRPPGAPERDELWIQRADQLVKLRRGDPDPRAVLALAAERAIDAPRGADVELVIAGDAIWIVQARPIVHPAPRVRTPPPPIVIAPLVADGRRWTWDVAHNPDPLSVAQAGLVERVEAAGIAPWSMRVCAGYLYTASGEPPPRPQLADRAALDAMVADLEARIERALGPDRELPIDEAIERYLAFYRIWACEVGPAISAARAGLSAAQLLGARPSAVEATLIAAARGELDEPAVFARLGAMAPAWDIAVPTFAERPTLLRAAIARAQQMPTPAPVVPSGSELARGGADLAERDDLWFARAQWLVRRALLARTRALGIAPDDAFWLPLDELAAATDLDPDDAHRRASAARTAAARSARWDMPLMVGGPPVEPGRALHGVGSGGRATGRVFRFDSLGRDVLVGSGDVVVVRAVTPALAVLVTGCAALVSETGGLLDHGAAMARELGIPCVVGCREAWSLLSDGMIVTVDGDAGTVAIAGDPTTTDLATA
ncbi:MAG: PEP/pyruvate-binding domain-containing protein [Kofleriaceae bacterium]